MTLLGWPVGHSLSPAMHNAAFEAEGLNCCYLASGVKPDLLAQAIQGLRALPFVGANVTIPHKETMIPLLDEMAESAFLAGAVNVIAKVGGRLIGHNTDGPGFIASLAAAGFEAGGKRVLVLGAGGGARGVATYLALNGAAEVTILNRTPERSAALAGAIRGVLGNVPSGRVGRAGDASSAVRAQPFGRASEILVRADLVVNCTSVGMYPDVEAVPPLDLAAARPGCLVVDTIYNPRPTRFLREAASRGLRTLDGLGMLVEQAALSWEIWFGHRGPAPVMMEAALSELERQ